MSPPPSARRSLKTEALVALGSNLPGPWGEPRQTIENAFAALDSGPTRLLGVSPVYRTKPMGRPHQPDYFNAVAIVDTALPPRALLRRLKILERESGRRGTPAPWGPRTLDLDILAYGNVVEGWHSRKPGFDRPGVKPLVLPHPHLHQRAFVLKPLADIAPDWRHPVLGRKAKDFWRDLQRQGHGEGLRPLPGADVAHGKPWVVSQFEMSRR
jgi:2-amino-4-hydroxy-6-hydroxymethyldihydropteridine diphosphokinase